MAMKKLIIKGLIALTAAVGAMITGWGVGSLFDMVDCAFEEEKEAALKTDTDAE